MKTLIVIPARYASTRYPGKPLVALTGANGRSKTLIERSWDAAKAVPGIDEVVVATDDDRISSACEAFGAQVVMTSEDLRNGTERCAAARVALGSDADIIVNLQGDAPLTPAWFIEDLVAAMKANPDAAVATPVLRCNGKTLTSLQADRAAGRVGGTTAVFAADGTALYFSKEVVPHCPQIFEAEDATPVFHHVGVYAYRADGLDRYLSVAPGVLENLEGLEQLRFMEAGIPVQCVEVKARGAEFWELNNPIDVERIESIMRTQGID